MMQGKPEPSPPTKWVIYMADAETQWLGSIEATGEIEAIEKASQEFKQPAGKLLAVRRET